MTSSFICRCGYFYDGVGEPDWDHKPDPDSCCNCGGQKCTACVSREVHEQCANDCPDCCAQERREFVESLAGLPAGRRAEIFRDAEITELRGQIERLRANLDPSEARFHIDDLWSRLGEARTQLAELRAENERLRANQRVDLDDWDDPTSAVAMITGLSLGRLAELGGVPDDDPPEPNEHLRAAARRPPRFKRVEPCRECDGSGRCWNHLETECMTCSGNGVCPHCHGKGHRG